MQHWNQFLQQLEGQIGKRNIDHWLRPLIVKKFDACNLYLEAQDSFQIHWFEQYVRPIIRTKFFNNNGHLIKVHLTLTANGEKAPETLEKEIEEAQEKKFESTPLNPQCQLSQFIAGEKNQLTYRYVCNLVSYDLKKKRFTTKTRDLAETNPLFIYGKSGSGKTHLLMAMAQALSNQGKQVIYVTAETFTDHVVKAFRSGDIHEFRSYYRSCDVLIVDDLQVFEKRTTTQEELFHTFNALHTANKLMIFAAHCSPRGLTGIEERLISRFEWGITLPLEPLSSEELKQVIEQKSKTLQFPLSNEVIHYLANQFSNHKAATKAIEALILRCHIRGIFKKHSHKMSSVEAQMLIEDIVQQEKQNELTAERLLMIVAKHFEITKEDLLSRSKAKEVVLPRQIAMYLCRTKLNLPYLKIGSIFSRDHSTVMSSVRLISKSLKNQDKRVILPYQNIQKEVLSA